MSKRIGFKPLWGDWARRKDLSLPGKVLALPLRLYEKLFYETRPNTVDNKLRSAEWAVMRSQARYLQSLFAYIGPPSHILWNIKFALAGVMIVAVLITLWEELRLTCCPGLPPLDSQNTTYTALRLASFAMSLILSLRIGRSYDRWWQARSCLGNCYCGFTRLIIQATVYFKDPWLVDELARWATVYEHSIYNMVAVQKKLDPEAAALLDEDELALYDRGPKSRQIVQVKMQQILADADLAPDASQIMEANLSRATQDAGVCARIRYNCLPYNLTLLSTGFIQIWLLLMPMGLWHDNYWFGLLPFFFVAVLLLGCDEVASQLEDPFCLLPLRDMLQVGTRDIRNAIADAATLKLLATRPRKAIGHVSTSTDGSIDKAGVNVKQS